MLNKPQYKRILWSHAITDTGMWPCFRVLINRLSDNQENTYHFHCQHFYAYAERLKYKPRLVYTCVVIKHYWTVRLTYLELFNYFFEISTCTTANFKIANILFAQSATANHNSGHFHRYNEKFSRSGLTSRHWPGLCSKLWSSMISEHYAKSCDNGTHHVGKVASRRNHIEKRTTNRQC